jgi:hypothetical protein
MRFNLLKISSSPTYTELIAERGYCQANTSYNKINPANHFGANSNTT